MAIPGQSTDDLLAQVAERDERACAAMYDLMAPTLLGLITRILPHRDAAEEVLEEAFLRLWSDARRLMKEQASASAALVLMAREGAVERLRAERHSGPPSNRPGGPMPGFARWVPRRYEIAMLDGRRELFKKVINQLPKPQRAALDLAVFEGCTEIDISVKMGEPLARVRSGLLAAARFVRHRLAAVMRTWAANI